MRQIEQEVKDRKTFLAPEIQKLRAMRQHMQDIEGTYLDKKKSYEQVVQTLDQEKEKIEAVIQKSEETGNLDEERKLASE